MVKDKKFLPIPVAIFTLLITVPIVFAFFFMILPSRPGCVQIMVKDPGEKPVAGAAVIIVYTESGQQIAMGYTGPGGRIAFCDIFKPTSEYWTEISKDNLTAIRYFTTNERSTASFPVIVKP